MAQMLWDQTDANGHVRHITADTYPNTPPKKLLLQMAFGDHQVANVSAEVAARTLGAYIRQPAVAADKVVPDVEPFFGIPAIPSFPFDGSAITVWDSGNPAPPVGNVPPRGPSPEDPAFQDLSECAVNHEGDQSLTKVLNAKNGKRIFGRMDCLESRCLCH